MEKRKTKRPKALDEIDEMAEEYDFSNAKRGSVLDHTGKTRITMWVDNGILEWFRNWSDRNSCGYQTAMNAALREYTERDHRPIAEVVRDVVRSEIRAALKK